MFDFDFDWEQHKHNLNKIFFHENGILRKGSSEILDFWNFLKKFLTFARKQSKHSNKLKSKDPDALKKINFRLKIERDPTAIADLHGKRKCRPGTVWFLAKTLNVYGCVIF